MCIQSVQFSGRCLTLNHLNNIPNFGEQTLNSSVSGFVAGGPHGGIWCVERYKEIAAMLIISRHTSSRFSAAPEIEERGGLRQARDLVAWNRSQITSSDVNEHKVRKIKEQAKKINV